MQRISSNMTLVYKIFFPTFWLIFMGLLTLYVLFADPETTPLLAHMNFKIIFAVMYLVFAILIYFICIKLMRMEVGEENFYISNFFKTYRYNYEDISSISENKFLFYKTLRIKMKSKTSLGKSFKILYKDIYWQDFIDRNPAVKKLITTP